jgi:aminopeptidase N
MTVAYRIFKGLGMLMSMRTSPASTVHRHRRHHAGRWTLAALFLLIPPPASAQELHPYRPGIDVLDYALTIDLPDTGSSIKGDAMLTVRRTARVDTLVLDLRLLQVQRVTLDDRTRKFARTDSTILIPLPRGRSGTFRVRVVYGGKVTDGLIAHRDSAKRWTYFGDNWPNRARFWIPSVDHPSDKASVTWTVRAPRGRTVVANGALVETRTLGTGRRARVLTRWRESKPIAPYLMVIGAGPLVKFDLGETACGLSELRKCVAQSVYVAPEQRKALPGAFAKAGDIVRFFATQVAPFPYEKLAHVQSSTRFGGMENAGAIFYSDDLFRKRGASDEGVIAHETAHQWFGDAVTEREWPHLWLSEGFATYFAALWTQRARGDSAFRADMSRIRGRVLDDTMAVPTRPVIDTVTTDLLDLLNRNSYEKGGFVLHMLRGEVGDTAFFAGLRDYYIRHKHSTALTADLQSSLEKVSGKTLGGFFDQWLRRPGYPEIELTWSDSALTSLSIGITQSGRYGLFEFPLRLALVDPNGNVRRVEVGVPAQLVTRIVLPVSGSVERIDADPDVQLLARITVKKAGS